MNKKFIIYIMFIILMSNIINAVVQDDFTTFTTPHNLTFEYGETQINYIQLPLYNNIVSANITIKGYQNENSMCFQEQANISTECGGLDTGNYRAVNNTAIFIPIGDGYWDGSYNFITAESPLTNEYSLFLNYTVPNNVNSPSIFQSRHQVGSEDTQTHNYTIPTDCYYNNQLLIRIGYSLLYNTVNIVCFNSTPSDINNITEGKIIYNSTRDLSYWVEEAMYWNISLYPRNLTIKINNTDVWNYTGIYNISNTTSDFSSSINTLLPSCSCTGCSISTEYCNVPVSFYSASAGILEVQNLYVNYSLNPSTLNIYLRDSSTKSLLITNLTIQVVGTDYQNLSTTTSGQTSFNISYDNVNSQPVSVRVFETNCNDYSIIINDIDLDQGIERNITLYLTNTSDTDTTNLVTFEVVDFNYNLIEGATISIEKQDPATNTYLQITDITTNSAGEATTILVTDTVFYRYYVTYEGNRVFTLNEPVTISLDTNKIQIVAIISQSYTDEIDRYYDTYVSAFNVTRPTNSSGFFTVKYSTESNTEGCLYVYNFTDSDSNSFDNLLNRTCVTQVSGTISSPTYTRNNESLFLAKFYVNYNDGEGEIFITQIARFIGAPDTPLDSTENIILFMVLILISALAYISNPIIGLTIMAVGTLIIQITRLMGNYLSLSTSVSIIFLCLISMYVVYNKKNE